MRFTQRSVSCYLAVPDGIIVQPPYDALLIVAFGGPEGPDEVRPFLENVLRGKNVPHQRMLDVVEHYGLFGGVSPLNEQIRTLLASLRAYLDKNGPPLKVYWGNRNWHPLLADTLQRMADDGVRRALALFTSPYSSYSSCRQYLEDIHRARSVVGERAPAVDKLRAFYNHPLLIEAAADRAGDALRKLPVSRRTGAKFLFTAHSIPRAMAENCPYEAQIRETSRLVCERLGRADWELVFQSRSGPPHQRWLEPDICDRLRSLHTADNRSDIVLIPIGFLSDHVEVIYDLDIEARGVCNELGLGMVRGQTVGNHPRFVEMIALLAQERLTERPVRLAIGTDGPSVDVCPQRCCPSGRPAARG